MSRNYWCSKLLLFKTLVWKAIFAAALIPLTRTMLQQVSSANGDHPPAFDSPPFQVCTQELGLADFTGCATILFAPDNAKNRALMAEVGQLNKRYGGPELNVFKDVLEGDTPHIPDFEHREIQPMASVGDMQEFFKRFPKSVAVGVDLTLANSATGTYEYTTYSRAKSQLSTIFETFGVKKPDERELRLMQLIDSALLLRENKGKKGNINNNKRKNEKYVVKYGHKNVPRDIGPMVKFMLMMFTRMIYPIAATQFMSSVLGTTLSRLWQEKRDRMSHYLRSVGMRTFPWLCVYLFLESIQYLIAGAVFYGSSVILQSENFAKIDAAFFFVAVLAQALGFTMFIILVNTVVPSMQIASQYSLINTTIILSTVMKALGNIGETANPELKEALSSGPLSQLSETTKALNFKVPWIFRALIFLFPVSSITRFWLMMLNQSMISDTVSFWDMRENVVDENDNLFDPPEGMSSITWNFLLMGINFVVLAVLNWYLKNVLPWTAGQSKPLYFLFTPWYWLGSKPYKPTQALLTRDPKGLDMNDSDISRVVEQSRKCAPNNLSLLFLTKTYFKGGLSKQSLLVNIFNMKGHQALEDFTIPMAKGELLALLGHNGAGKSTLLSIITGSITPNAGGAVVLEGSVIQPDYLNKKMGVCAQADLLFGYMTVRQHILMLMGLRNVSASKNWPEMMRRLEAFRMTGAIDRRADQLSGGMKRRLSLLLATIGDPKVLLMDEPTAGMDPVNRRFVWKFLEEFRKDRYTLLTTHSMEEAENLAETIAVVRKGRLVAVGSTGHLRNRYALGYRLNLTVRNGGEDELDKHVVGKVPGMTPEVRHTGMLRYLVPEESIGEMVTWLKEVETHRIKQKTEAELVAAPSSNLVTPPPSGEIDSSDTESEVRERLSPVMPVVETNPDGYVADWLFTQMTLEDVFHKLNAQVYQATAAETAAKK